LPPFRIAAQIRLTHSPYPNSAPPFLWNCCIWYCKYGKLTSRDADPVETTLLRDDLLSSLLLIRLFQQQTTSGSGA